MVYHLNLLNKPFKFVEYEELRTWISYLNLCMILISINTRKNDVFRIFMKEKNMMKE